MSDKCGSCAPNDLVGTPIAWLVWCLPALLLAVGLLWSQGRFWLWTPALVVAGAACVVNATRCGRLHCYFTGPLYLLGAAYLVGAKLGTVPLRPFWFLGLIVSASAVAQLAELPLGKYAKTRTRDDL